MHQGRIIIITGSPGTGKTTIASIVAHESDFAKSVHMHTDDFYHYLSKGAIPPHLPESQEQNLVVVEAFLEAAKRYAHGGYDVIVDGIIGPWFLAPWMKIVQEGYEVHYIVLRADKEETMKRAIERTKLSKEANIELVEVMWEQFAKIGDYESFVINKRGKSIYLHYKREYHRESPLLCVELIFQSYFPSATSPTSLSVWRCFISSKGCRLSA